VATIFSPISPDSASLFRERWRLACAHPSGMLGRKSPCETTFAAAPGLLPMRANIAGRFPARKKPASFAAQRAWNAAQGRQEHATAL